MPEHLKIGFLGAGRMASALACGFVKAGLASKAGLIASDISAPARESFAKATGALTTGFNPDVVKFASVLIIAVKPAQVSALLNEIDPGITEDHLLISIAAGIPLARIESELPEGARVIRVMPNTPALVEASASAFALGKSATREDAELASRLCSSVGLAYEVKESLLDAVTGLSGSGPAYIYMIIEALSDGGVASGLPRDIATRLAAQTVLGAAKMVLETNQHPGALKDMVTSPGGTTIEGVHELEKSGVRGALMNAVRAAANKAAKLGKN
jgi:pyrroline-5-carboxylate reductase